MTTREGEGPPELAEPRLLVPVGVHLGGDGAGPPRPGQVGEHLGDRLRAETRHPVLVVQPAGAGRDDAVGQVDVAQPRPERQGEVESVAPGDGGVREVEGGRLHVEGRGVVSRAVGVEPGRPEPHGEHVLDGEGDARLGRDLADDVDEPRRVGPLPDERRMDDDGRGAQLAGQSGRAPQLVDLVTTEGEVRDGQDGGVHREHGQAPPGGRRADQLGASGRPVGRHHHLDPVEAGEPREPEGLVGRQREDAGRAHSDRDHAARLRPGRLGGVDPAVNSAGTAGYSQSRRLNCHQSRPPIATISTHEVTKPAADWNPGYGTFCP